jgi:hypothetical protein
VGGGGEEKFGVQEGELGTACSVQQEACFNPQPLARLVLRQEKEFLNVYSIFIGREIVNFLLFEKYILLRRKLRRDIGANHMYYIRKPSPVDEFKDLFGS